MASVVAPVRRRRPSKSAVRLRRKEKNFGGLDKAQTERGRSKEAEFERRTLGGLKWAEAEKLAKSLRLSMVDLAGYAGIPSSTFFTRKNSRFDSAESDRLIRLERLLALALKAFESAEGAAEWLSTPQVGLAGEVPLQKSKTEPGARQVEVLLQRIDLGLA